MRSLILVAMALFVIANPCIAADMPSIGNPPPVLTLPNLTNKPVNLSNNSGKPTVIAFFASWSKPCADEMKALNSLYNEYKDKGVNVVAVALDRKADAVTAFREDNGIDFEILLDKRLRSINKYAILIIPTTFVVGKDGNLANIFVDYDENVEKSIRGFIADQLAD